MALASTSTAPAYKAALLAAIKANADIIAAKVQVSSTFPGDTLQPVAVYYGHVIATITTPDMAGAARLRRQEEYLVETHIDVSNAGPLVDPAETIAFGIMGAIDGILAVTPLQGIQSGNTYVWKSYVASWESRPYYDETRQGFALLLTIQIKVTARLA